MADQGDDDQHDEAERHAGDAAHADQVPDIRVIETDRHILCVPQQQHIHDGAHDDQRDQRRQERPQPEEPDQHAVDEPDRAAHQDHRRHDRGHWPAGQIQQRQRSEIAQREVGPNAQIDPADDDHRHHRNADQTELAKLAAGDHQDFRGEEVRDQNAERRDHAQQHRERHRVVDPFFRQHFADQMVGKISVSQAGKGFPKRDFARGGC
ncbi:hypothetical protein GALL_480340 [mine drainage metagenome]|uniref:Uncharacterized protein n=1 Tax=mine drainage metagenome TaxID=410659 RepID=A0A1J5PGL9_9ZZZZ